MFKFFKEIKESFQEGLEEGRQELAEEKEVEKAKVIKTLVFRTTRRRNIWHVFSCAI